MQVRVCCWVEVQLSQAGHFLSGGQFGPLSISTTFSEMTLIFFSMIVVLPPPPPPPPPPPEEEDDELDEELDDELLEDEELELLELVLISIAPEWFNPVIL